jgi:polyisoprenoid-binding protein YceI
MQHSSLPENAMPARHLLALAAVLSAGVLNAAPAQAPGQPDPARVTAGTYAADPAHTMVEFRINHMGFTDVFGLFGSITGTLMLDPAHLDQAQVAVRIPVRKILTTSQGLTEHLFMPGGADGKPDYFGPKPADALFSSTKVVPGTDGTSAAITGNLTLNGVTRPVTIAARFTGAGKGLLGGGLNVGFEGTAQIKRSDFGLVADLPLVGDSVDLKIAATFVHK